MTSTPEESTDRLAAVRARMAHQGLAARVVTDPPTCST